MRKFKKVIIAILILTIAAFGILKFNSIKLENYKTEIVKDLDKYYLINKQFPKALTETNVGKKYDFEYKTNENQNFYSMTYRTGIMNCNIHCYDSKSKKWTTVFTY